MDRFFEEVAACPLFTGIAREPLRAMLRCLDAAPRSYGRGETILAEGDPASRVGVVLRGTVQVVRVDYAGNRSIMSRLGAGELFAEAFACAGVTVMPVTVVAAEVTQALLIDAQRLTHTCAAPCQAHGQMIRNLIGVLADKSLQSIRRLEVNAQRGTRGKLMAYLHMQSRAVGSATFVIPYDRQELADYLGVERSGLSTVISQLRREGVIDCARSRFTLLGEA